MHIQGTDNKIVITRKFQLVMSPAIILKSETKPSNILNTLSISEMRVYIWEKNMTFVDALHLYTWHRDEKDIPIVEANHIKIKNENYTSLKDDNFVCSLVEVETDRIHKFKMYTS